MIRSREILCRKCQKPMQLLADIPTIGELTGMRAYECVECGTQVDFPHVAAGSRPPDRHAG